jgi:hypothetical protein
VGLQAGRSAPTHLVVSIDGGPEKGRHHGRDRLRNGREPFPPRRPDVGSCEDHHPHEAAPERVVLGRVTLWLHPSIPLQFSFESDETFEMDRPLLEDLMHGANGGEVTVRADVEELA